MVSACCGFVKSTFWRLCLQRATRIEEVTSVCASKTYGLTRAPPDPKFGDMQKADVSEIRFQEISILEKVMVCTRSGFRNVALQGGSEVPCLAFLNMYHQLRRSSKIRFREREFPDPLPCQPAFQIVHSFRLPYT